MPPDTPTIDAVTVRAFTIPTETPESDGTLEWNATTLVLVEIDGGGRRGIGYTYADSATARLIRDRLAPLVEGRDAFAIAARRAGMIAALRNLGACGIGAMAVSAVDVALWDLKARCLGLPLAALLGRARDAIPVYASGGFTSQSQAELRQQLGGWVQDGHHSVKMKVGREPAEDTRRVAVARAAIGSDTALLVDANGAYRRKEALALAEQFAGFDVCWFEEPLPKEDLEGLRLLRDHAPGGLAIAGGEYVWQPDDARRLLEAGAVDVLQADATRCGGISGFLAVAALCEAFHLPLSSHCAPALHLPLMCAVAPALHLEYFHDHVRIEQMLFDGIPKAERGLLTPADERPGLGLAFKEQDARCFMT